MKRIYYFLILIGLFYCFYGCKSYTTCSSFIREYKLNAKDVPIRNNGIYFSCYLEEEPVVYTMDSSIENSFPWYLHGSSKYLENPRYLRLAEDIGIPEHLKDEVISYTIIKLKVKPIEVYFTKYSYNDFRNLNMNIGGEKIPNKESFLGFNTLYYITCDSSDINAFKELYAKKMLILLDQEEPETKADYFYCFNVYPANKIDFRKLYSFEKVVKDLKKENE